MYADFICYDISHYLQIKTLSFYTFGLFLENKRLYFPPSEPLREIISRDTYKNDKIFFRLRFIPNSLQDFKKFDSIALTYLFNQVRHDFIHSYVPNINLIPVNECLGLVIADIMQLQYKIRKDYSDSEPNIDEIIDNYQKHLPLDKITYYNKIRLMLYAKQQIKSVVKKLTGDIKDLDKEYFYKVKYIETLLKIPQYFIESFKCVISHPQFKLLNDGIIYLEICSDKALKFLPDGSKSFLHLCDVNELCFLTKHSLTSIEISRKNGIPFRIEFTDELNLRSFLSLLDGYYRLSVKFTFHLCTDCYSPTLAYLKSIYSHGPVDYAFVLNKFKEKKAFQSGSYLIRQYPILVIKDGVMKEGITLSLNLTMDRYIIDVCVNPEKDSDSSIYNVSSTGSTKECPTIKSLVLVHYHSKHVESQTLDGEKCELLLSPNIQRQNTENVSSNFDPKGSNSSSWLPSYFKVQNVFTTAKPHIYEMEALELKNSNDTNEIDPTTPYSIEKSPQFPRLKSPEESSWSFENSALKFDTLKKLLNYYTSHTDRFKFTRCLPPSDYDKPTNLLICRQYPLKNGKAIHEFQHHTTKNQLVCVNWKDLKFAPEMYKESIDTVISSYGNNDKSLQSSAFSENRETLLTENETYKNLIGNLEKCKFKLIPNVTWIKDVSTNKLVSIKYISNGIRDNYKPEIADNWDCLNYYSRDDVQILSAVNISRILKMINSYAFLNDPTLIRIHAICLDPLMLVTESMPWGPWDKFLMAHVNTFTIGVCELLEACSNVSKALWYLEDQNLVHGAIKCNNIYVYPKSSNSDLTDPSRFSSGPTSFGVKLSDPLLVSCIFHENQQTYPIQKNHENYKNTSPPASTDSYQFPVSEKYLNNLPWLAPERISEESEGRGIKSAATHATDVWAFGTTMWETLSYCSVDPYTSLIVYAPDDKFEPSLQLNSMGLKHDHQTAYHFFRDILRGKRLPRTDNCPKSLYKIMLKCWDYDPISRIKIQELVRDVHQIYHYTLNSRLKADHRQKAFLQFKQQLYNKNQLPQSPVTTLSSLHSSNLHVLSSFPLLDGLNKSPTNQEKQELIALKDFTGTLCFTTSHTTTTTIFDQSISPSITAESSHVTQLTNLSSDLLSATNTPLPPFLTEHEIISRLDRLKSPVDEPHPILPYFSGVNLVELNDKVDDSLSNRNKKGEGDDFNQLTRFFSTPSFEVAATAKTALKSIPITTDYFSSSYTDERFKNEDNTLNSFYRKSRLSCNNDKRYQNTCTTYYPNNNGKTENVVETKSVPEYLNQITLKAVPFELSSTLDTKIAATASPVIDADAFNLFKKSSQNRRNFYEKKTMRKSLNPTTGQEAHAPSVKISDFTGKTTRDLGTISSYEHEESIDFSDSEGDEVKIDRNRSDTPTINKKFKERRKTDDRDGHNFYLNPPPPPLPLRPERFTNSPASTFTNLQRRYKFLNSKVARRFISFLKINPPFRRNIINTDATAEAQNLKDRHHLLSPNFLLNLRSESVVNKTDLPSFTSPIHHSKVDISTKQKNGYLPLLGTTSTNHLESVSKYTFPPHLSGDDDYVVDRTSPEQHDITYALNTSTSFDSYTLNKNEDPWIIPESHLTYLRQLGQGNFGEVWLADWEKYGRGMMKEKVAVKIFKKIGKLKEDNGTNSNYSLNSYNDSIIPSSRTTNYELNSSVPNINCESDANYISRPVSALPSTSYMKFLRPQNTNKQCCNDNAKDVIQNEIDIMKRFSQPTFTHRNIVQIKGIVLKYPLKKLVMEYMQLGALDSYLQTFPDRVDSRLKMKYVSDIATGMDYLNNVLGIVHRDLSARNVLLTNDAKSVKISDFGLAAFLTLPRPTAGNDAKNKQFHRETEIRYGVSELRDKLDADFYYAASAFYDSSRHPRPFYNAYYEDTHMVNRELPICWFAPECLPPSFHFTTNLPSSAAVPFFNKSAATTADFDYVSDLPVSIIPKSPIIYPTPLPPIQDHRLYSMPKSKFSDEFISPEKRDRVKEVGNGEEPGTIRFTQKSDVWSFGVTCWEIWSCGVSPLQVILRRLVVKHFLPLPSPLDNQCNKNFENFEASLEQYDVESFLLQMNATSFVNELHKLLIEDGWRLPRPIECPIDFYDFLVKDCWNIDPSKRSSFPRIKEMLKKSNWLS